MRFFQAERIQLITYKAAAKNKNNSTETDHASTPLGIFAFKLTTNLCSVDYNYSGEPLGYLMQNGWKMDY